jgi:hypothetical protein
VETVIDGHQRRSARMCACGSMMSMATAAEGG